MTVADNTSRNQYTATSGQTVFAYTFEIVDKDHIVVLQNGTALSEGTDYTVSNVGNDNGGNVTLTSGATAGDVMTLYRDMPYSRTQNYTNSGDFLASEVNADFDELWLAGEQTDRSFSQSIRKPITDSDSISMELPEAADRANKFVKFDANGAVDVAGATVTVPADSVTISDAGNYYTSNDVEGALQEVGADLDSINTDLGTKLSNVVDDTTPQLGGNLDTNGNSINFGDDDRANFGDSQDLQLYHDGSNSYIYDQGTGYLVLQSGGPGIRLNKSNAEVMVDAIPDGAVTLYHDNSAKIATSSTGVDITGNVTLTGTVDGRDVAADGTKLDGIASGAEVNVVDSVNTQTGAVVLDADDISDSTTTNKFTTASDISKLAGIEPGATTDQTPAEIKTAYESNANTNAFTDAEKTKLSGISAGAEVNAVDSVNTQTGAVVLDADDIDDSTTTHKFTTASDISKLAGIEAGADVTDTANVTAAGAVMDSELTNESAVKALDQGVATTDSPSFAGLTVDTNTLKVDSTNNRVGILNATPDVALDVGSATDAVHVPVGTTAQRPSTPAAGYLRYNSTTGKFEGYTTEWGSIGEALTDVSVDSFTGTGTQTAFTLSGDPGSENNLQVYVDGVYQNKDTFTVVSTTLTFSEAPPLDALIEACTLNEIGSIIVPADGSVNSAKIASGAVTSSKLGGDLTTPGNLDVTGSMTADSATIEGGLTVSSTFPTITFTDTDSNPDYQLRSANGYFQVYDSTNTAPRLLVDNGGDTSFYNSAGTSQDFYWDASESRLGLGTDSPGTPLDIVSSNANAIGLRLRGRSSDDLTIIQKTDNGATTQQGVIAINSSGNVGIGNTLPSAAIDVEGSSGGAVQAVISDGANQASLQLSKSANFYGIKAGSDYGGLLFFSNSATERMRIDSSGNVGIGGSPSSKLHVKDTNSIIYSEGTGGYGAFYAKGSGTNAAYIFMGNDGGEKGRVQTENDGTIVFSNTTSATPRMRIDSSGNLLLGGTQTPTSSQGNLALFNGVVPTGGVTDGIVLYAEDVSSSSELKVRDEAGNITTLSPHNFELIPEGPSEDMAWSYFSEKDGKQINVDMLKAIRLLERMSGEKLVFEN